jgi:molybdenum cofactor cytidylyltransferase
MSAPAARVAAIVLAAGEGKRFGGRKLQAPLDGKPLVQHVIDAANASSLSPVVVVTGSDADALLAGLRLGAARAVHNAEYAHGQAGSLALGLRSVGDADAAVVLLGDQPRVAPALLEALVVRQRESGAAAVVSSSNGRRMPPTLLHRDLWPAVLALTGDVGAREVLAGRDDVVAVEVGGALGALDDVDTPDDHARLSR